MGLSQKRIEVARECLKRGVEAVKPWGHVGDIGAAVQEYSVVEFGGHGIGTRYDLYGGAND